MNSQLIDPAKASTLLGDLFGPGVSAYELRGAGDPTTLMPAEAVSCEAFRPGRLAEFAAGRLCARRALADLGVVDFAVARNSDRTPRWPEAVVGSITHTVGFCGAVAAPRTAFAGLGVDAEIVARVTPDLWRHAFTSDEVARFATVTYEERQALAAVAFSAKEAFYKCQYSVTGLWLDYCDVSVEITAEHDGRGAFRVAPANERARWTLGDRETTGRYRIERDLVVTGIAMRAQTRARRQNSVRTGR
jgi:4'-phosphopantetheinyl transferase EntD